MRKSYNIWGRDITVTMNLWPKNGNFDTSWPLFCAIHLVSWLFGSETFWGKSVPFLPTIFDGLKHSTAFLNDQNAQMVAKVLKKQVYII